MATLNPYLLFNGNAEEAFNFYKTVFGGEIPMMMRFKDAPPEFRGAENEADKIMHICLPVGKSVLMASDAPETQRVNNGTNFSISISADSTEEADRIYNALAEGGTAYMPMSKAFWGSYFGMLSDKFNVNWMISFDRNPGQQS